MDDYTKRCKIARLLRNYETNQITYAEFEESIINMIDEG